MQLRFSYYKPHYTFYALTQVDAEREEPRTALRGNRRRIMRKSFVVLTYALLAAGVAGSLTGCVVAPAEPAYGYYAPGYDYGYYSPGYYPYPAYPETSVGIGIGFGGGGGWHHHDRDWHGGGCRHGGRGGHHGR